MYLVPSILDRLSRGRGYAPPEFPLAFWGGKITEVHLSGMQMQSSKCGTTRGRISRRMCDVPSLVEARVKGQRFVCQFGGWTREKSAIRIGVFRHVRRFDGAEIC